MKLYNTLYAMGSKEAGSSIGKQAGKFIYSYLEKNFSKCLIREEKFRIERQKPIKAELTFESGTISGHLYENTGVEGSEVRGQIKQARWWSILFLSKTFAGKIIIVKQNLLFHRMWLVKRAYENAALAVIYIPNTHNHIPAGLGYPYLLGACTIPVLGIKYENFLRLKKSRVDTIRITYKSKSEPNLQCQNIIMRAESDRNNYKSAIVLGAHYDSWYGGAHDNCIAVQLMTDVFDMLLKKRLGHPIQAIYLDAEEVGLLGTKHHIANLVDNSYAFYFNFEMPLPTQNGIINTLLYSDHAVCKKALRHSINTKAALIPLPLKTYYRLLPAFPSDLDLFYKEGIPSMSTFYHNPYAHTVLDNGDNLRWNTYPVIRETIVQTICEIDRVL